jgi:hypothetical protein
LKITPIAGYAVEIIWQWVIFNNLERLRGVKVTFLRRPLQLSINAPPL